MIELKSKQKFCPQTILLDNHESKERGYYYNLDKISGKVGNNQITPSILNSVRDILNTIN